MPEGYAWVHTAAGRHGMALVETGGWDAILLDPTPRGFDLLQHWLEHPERVFSRMELLNRPWGVRHEGHGHAVNTPINCLRGKVVPGAGAAARRSARAAFHYSRLSAAMAGPAQGGALQPVGRA